MWGTNSWKTTTLNSHPYFQPIDCFLPFYWALNSLKCDETCNPSEFPLSCLISNTWDFKHVTLKSLHNIYVNGLHRSIYTEENEDTNGALAIRNGLTEPPRDMNQTRMCTSGDHEGHLNRPHLPRVKLQQVFVD